MAKKEAKEMSVEQKLQALYELQTTLTAIDEKRALRGELPLEVQDLEDEIAGLDTRIEKIDTEIKEFQSAITMKKGEVQEAQANLERYNNQLNEVRNNREYDSLSKQIDYERLEVELCNKKIKEATDQVAYRTNDLEIAKTEREERQKDLDEKKSELEDQRAEAIAKLETDGTVILNSGGADLGTGLDTISAKAVKEVLKLPMEKITVVSGDTDSCVFDTGAYASSGTFFSGNASLLAAKKLKEKILAAKRAGIKELILCSENKKDIDEIKPEYLKGLEFHYVTDIREVVELALLKEKVD